MPVFQASKLIARDQLLTDIRHAYPDLGAVSVGVAGTVASPTRLVKTEHPYARGFSVEHRGRVRELSMTQPEWSLDLSPGEHAPEIGLLTAYATIPAGRVSYRVA